MSQTEMKFPKLTIKQKRPNEPLTGANTCLELDGVPLKGVQFLKLEIKAGKVAKVLLEMVAGVEFEAELGELEMRPRRI